MNVNDQLLLDMELFGVAYYTTDGNGNKTRIDPLTLVIMKSEDGIISIEQKQAFPVKCKTIHISL